MEPIYIIKPSKISDKLELMIAAYIGNKPAIFIDENSLIPDLKGKKLLFVAELNSLGFCLPIINILCKLQTIDPLALKASVGSLIVTSETDLYTKNATQGIVFLANQLGCLFLGHPVVEVTSGYKNFLTWQKTLNIPLKDICLMQCEKLGNRIQSFNKPKVKNPKLLVLHASYRKTSNTLMLWNLIKEKLPDFEITELHVENGTVLDCIGCPFKTCTHYSKQNSCFYGGFMIDEILPSIEKSDAIIWICPNYNDAVSANISAVINRLTALYRKISFYDKSVFGIVVSGNSGSDSVARQLISSLNINKGFMLPPNFAIMEIANDPNAIKKIPNIEIKAQAFAESITNHLLR